MSYAPILSVGFEYGLLNPRSRILENAGHKVVEASTETEALQHLQSSGFGLIVLCYSIPERQREELASKMRDYSPSTPIMAVARRSQQEEYQFADVTVKNDSLALLTGIGALLQTGRVQPAQRRPQADVSTGVLGIAIAAS